MDEKLKQLYQKVILQHSRHPHGYDAEAVVTHRVAAYNPLCGDKFELLLEIEGQTLRQIHFGGHGCAISKASTSVLTKKLNNLPLQEAFAKCQYFLDLTDGTIPADHAEDEEYEAFLAARDFPGRRQCAILSWESLRDFLAKKVGH